MSVHSFSVSGDPEAYLNTLVKQGYSKSSIIQDALRLKMERDAGNEDRLEQMRVDLDQVKTKLDQILESLGVLRIRAL